LEIESARIIETLRILRDQYRQELTKLGCKPLSEMYWVVFRHAIVPAAARLLRETTAEYVVASRVDRLLWQQLYGFTAPLSMDIRRSAAHSTSATTSKVVDEREVRTIINCAISEDTISDVAFGGGPFSKAAQLVCARRSPWVKTLVGEITLQEEFELRSALWDDCRPLTEGLTRLWDATQEELMQQFHMLREESRRIERTFVNLTSFQQIVYRHLRIERRGAKPRSRITPSSWSALALELDQNNIALEAELSPLGKKLLSSLRKKGKRINTWQEALNPALRTVLDNGKMCVLPALVMQTLHNAEKTASYHIQKIWPTGKQE
jgi:hypothetical protein